MLSSYNPTAFLSRNAFRQQIAVVGTHSMNISYRLEDLDTEQPDTICDLVTRFYRAAFPETDTFFIKASIDYVVAMFDGKSTGFQPMDTQYHDLEHTLQATLCFVRLIITRHQAGIAPQITATDFETGFIATLLHDIGYLKQQGDDKGTGAKYTLIHELRSAEHARLFLRQKNWPKDRIVAVEHLILSTGPRSSIQDIPFASERERMLGQAVCTADFVSQMSDPRYVEKLPRLYQEFKEYYEYENIPVEQRPFATYQDLLQKTPLFWREFVQQRMNKECDCLWEFLRDPATGINPYIDRIEKNIQIIETLVKNKG